MPFGNVAEDTVTLGAAAGREERACLEEDAAGVGSTFLRAANAGFVWVGFVSAVFVDFTDVMDFVAFDTDATLLAGGCALDLLVVVVVVAFGWPTLSTLSKLTASESVSVVVVAARRVRVGRVTLALVGAAPSAGATLAAGMVDMRKIVEENHCYTQFRRD